MTAPRNHNQVEWAKAQLQVRYKWKAENDREIRFLESLINGERG